MSAQDDLKGHGGVKLDEIHGSLFSVIDFSLTERHRHVNDEVEAEVEVVETCYEMTLGSLPGVVILRKFHVDTHAPGHAHVKHEHGRLRQWGKYIFNNVRRSLLKRSVARFVRKSFSTRVGSRAARKSESIIPIFFTETDPGDHPRNHSGYQ